MKNIAYKIILPIFSIFFLISCENNTAELDLESIGFDGSTQDIQDFLSEDIYDALIDLGLDINTGNNPENIEGTFLISPRTLSATNIEDDFPIGQLFVNKIITFSSQNNDELTVNFEAREVDSDGNIISTQFGVGSFISGTENGDFTVILKVTGQSSGISTETAIAISGNIDASGIYNLQESFIITDKGPDPDEQLIEIGEGRLIIDSNNISERE